MSEDCWEHTEYQWEDIPSDTLQLIVFSMYATLRQNTCENTLHNGIEKSVSRCSNNPQHHWRHAIERMRIPEYEVRMK